MAKATGPGSSVRAALRLGAFVTATFFFALAIYAGAAVLSLLGRPTLHWRVRCARAWGRATLRSMGVRVRVVGRPPEAPFLLVSNHTGYVDIPVLGCPVQIVFIANEQIRRWPFLGRFSAAAGTLFIDRASRRDITRTLAEMEERFAAGVGIGFFPEGQSSGGDDVLPFRPPLFELAARSGRPVWWASVRYEVPKGFPEPGESVAWWGPRHIGRHFWGILRMPWVQATVRFGTEPFASTDRKVLAETLWRSVRDDVRPDRA